MWRASYCKQSWWRKVQGSGVVEKPASCPDRRIYQKLWTLNGKIPSPQTTLLLSGDSLQKFEMNAAKYLKTMKDLKLCGIMLYEYYLLCLHFHLPVTCNFSGKERHDTSQTISEDALNLLFRTFFHLSSVLKREIVMGIFRFSLGFALKLMWKKKAVTIMQKRKWSYWRNKKKIFVYFEESYLLQSGKERGGNSLQQLAIWWISAGEWTTPALIK